MLKLIRKYKTFLLVIFGVGLMLIYIVPQGFSRSSGPSAKGPVIGTLGATSIHRNALDRAHNELELIVDLTSRGVLNREFGMLANVWSLDPQDSEHWMLLTEAAKRSGFVGEAGDGRNFVDNLLIASGTPTTDEDRSNLIRAFASTLNMRTEKDVLESLANINGVIRMFGTYSSTIRTSTPRVVLEAKHDEDRASVNAVFIPGAASIDPTSWQPTDTELVAHFEKYRNTKPTEGEFGIGYLLPNRVMLEVLEIKAQAIRDTLTLDRIEVRKEYDRNRETYTGDFETHRAEVETNLKNREYEKVIASVRRAVRAETHNTVDALKRGPDGYRILPSDWASTMPHLASMTGAIVQQVKEELDYDIPVPEVSTTENLTTYADLAAYEKLQGVATAYSGNPVSMSVVVFNAKEFDPQIDIGVQKGLPLLDFEGRRENGDFILVTILEAVTESPAASIDEVREKVAKDFRSLSGYEILKAGVQDIRQHALSGGLTSLTDAYPSAEFPAVVASSITVTRTNVTGTEGRLRDEEFADAVIDHCATIDPLKPIIDVPIENRTVVTSLPKQLGVAVAQIVGTTPLTHERFRVASWNTITKLRIEGLGFRADAVKKPTTGFAFDPLATRLNWQPKAGISRRNAETDSES